MIASLLTNTPMPLFRGAKPGLSNPMQVGANGCFDPARQRHTGDTPYQWLSCSTAYGGYRQKRRPIGREKLFSAGDTAQLAPNQRARFAIRGTKHGC